MGSGSGRCGYLAALFSAAMAGLRACLAVLHVVLRTFVTARLANNGADFADFLHVATASRHHCGRYGTDLGAVHIPRNALGHCLDVELLQTCHRAMVASCRAGVAGLHTRAIRFVRHCILLKLVCRGSPPSRYQGQRFSVWIQRQKGCRSSARTAVVPQARNKSIELRPLIGWLGPMGYLNPPGTRAMRHEASRRVAQAEAYRGPQRRMQKQAWGEVDSTYFTL